MTRVLRCFVLPIALLVLAPGCAGFQHAMARNRYISQQAQEHVYPRALAEIWPYTRQLLFEAGYSVRNTGEAMTFTIETEWREDQGGASRYLVQGLAVGERASRVQFTLVTRNPQGDSWRRDVGMEWMLLRRADPEGAAQIEADGERYAGN